MSAVARAIVQYTRTMIYEAEVTLDVEDPLALSDAEVRDLIDWDELEAEESEVDSSEAQSIEVKRVVKLGHGIPTITAPREDPMWEDD